MKFKAVPVLTFIIIVLLISNILAQDVPKFRLIRVEPEKTAGTEEDGLELFRPTALAYNPYNDLLYVADTGNHRIVILNTNLEYVAKFGLHGQGPGEFDRPKRIAFNKDECFFIYDEVNRRINTYNPQYKYLYSFRLPGRFRGYFDILLDTDSQGRLFMNLPSLGHIVTIFDNKGGVVGGIENIGSAAETVEGWFGNRCLGVIDKDDFLYCFFTDKMLLRKYNLETGKNIKEISYEFIPWVKDRVKGVDENKRKRGVFIDYQLALEISYDAYHLFLRFTVIDPKNGNQNRVYIFDKDFNVKPDVLSFMKQYLTTTEFNHPEYFFTLDKIFCKVYRYSKKEVSCLKK